MKRLTKILTLILALTMIFSLAACNKDDTSPAGSTPPPSDNGTPPTDNGEDTKNDQSNNENNENKTENGGENTENNEGNTEKEENTTLFPDKNVICQLKNSTYSQMMGYVLTTSDGKLIVIDGGTEGDADNLLATIKEMSGQEIPHIDAWILTHPHSDHIDAFNKLVENNWSEFEVDKIYYNFPDEEFVEKHEKTSLVTIQKFNSLKEKFADKLVVSKEKDKYTIGEAKIDVLFVFDENITFNPINNSSMIFRLTLAGKRMMFLGDSYVQAGNALLDKYGVRIFADYCQMAHHGQSGVNRDVYTAINPSVCFWDSPEWLYNNYKDNNGKYNSGPYQTVTVRGWMESIGTKTHYVQMNGNNYIDFATGLPITPPQTQE